MNLLSPKDLTKRIYHILEIKKYSAYNFVGTTPEAAVTISAKC